MTPRPRGELHISKEKLHEMLGLSENLMVINVLLDSFKGGILVTIQGKGMPDYIGYGDMKRITMDDIK